MNLQSQSKFLRAAAEEIRKEGHAGWGNTCEQAADAIDALLREREAAKVTSLDYNPGNLDRTAPAKIWLQINTDGDSSDRDEPWPGADAVTWQDESIGGLEIQYVRADLVVPMLASARVPDGWRTMESAPKDGTSVLLAFRERSGKYNIQGGRWNTDSFSKRIRPYWCGDRTYLGTTYFRACQPTHWQPLAAAPKPETEE